jgi:hypothetical protein
MTGRCNAPEKARYATRGQAKAAALLIRREGGGPNYRIYRCGCGSFHLTSKVQ